MMSLYFTAVVIYDRLKFHCFDFILINIHFFFTCKTLLTVIQNEKKTIYDLRKSIFSH
jgi:hypothetical protein